MSPKPWPTKANPNGMIDRREIDRKDRGAGSRRALRKDGLALLRHAFEDLKPLRKKNLAGTKRIREAL